MGTDWVRLCRAKDFIVSGSSIVVRFRNERKHRVTIEDNGDAYLAWAFVTRKPNLDSAQDLPVQVWIRNRVTQLVGFRFDDRGRLRGEAWIPKIGLKPEEFQVYLQTVAFECDRFEFVLTGKDVE